MSLKNFFEMIAIFFFGLHLSGCGKVWYSATYPDPSAGTTRTYEYLYTGDSNVASLPGYSINTTTGVLTAIPNWPTQIGSISLAKISNSLQIIMADQCCGISATFSVAPTTGILSPTTGTGVQLQGSVASSSGLYVYSIDGGLAKAWISSLNPTNGNFVSSVETSSMPAPMTNAFYSVVSPDGNYVYFVDPYDNAIAAYATGGGALNLVTGADTGNGTVVGNITYGLTLLPTPNAGQYHGFGSPYLDVAANVLYLYYGGSTAAQHSWIIPYKIGSDGSLTAGALLDLGINTNNGASIAGDSSGQHLFVAKSNATGVSSYTIGTNGALSLFSGPIWTNLYSLMTNASTSLLIGEYHATLYTASISAGVLTPQSTYTTPCAQDGPTVLDPSEKFLYFVQNTPAPNEICGMTIDPLGNLGAISGQSYPLTVTGSQALDSAFAVKMTVP